MISESPPVHQFHHQRAHPVELFEAVDVGDVRVIEGGERLRLTREPRQAIGIGGERSGSTFSATSRLSRRRVRDKPRPCLRRRGCP